MNTIKKTASPLRAIASPREKKSSAFTLIELLTVIAIIGILAGILIPVTLRVRDSAWAARGISQKRQITLALAAYATENKNYYPPVMVVVGSDYLEWNRHPLLPYLPARTNSRGIGDGYHEIFADPKAVSKGNPGVKVRCGYSAGGTLYRPPTNQNLTSTNPGNPSSPDFGRRLDTIENPKNAVLFFDAVVNSATNKDKSVVGVTWTDFNADLVKLSDKLADNDAIDYRYRGTAQFAFADYHVEALTPQKAKDKFTDHFVYEGRVQQ
ncbi:prepilin-type N-terminal cleavage/methylation domain-containing protein [Opitutaceae bacterium TAV4]|nr:prepilin-type N-terminal cleavage/methylation domain-containing protein [Opitutaceae bacterium TAV4]RRK02191.1 prepilin-type N-terminal cleavage/methylation domain-containing protein [Opitutaceae bacterium TAV3]